MREEQTISPSGTASRTAVSWTGGKDCNLALLAAWRDPSLHVTDLIVFGLPNAFRAHPIELMEAQASSLGLPLRILPFPEEVDDWKGAYVGAIRTLRDAHGVRVIATGDMDLVGTMSSNWITDCCDAAGGVRSYLPLWKADRANCLDTLVKERFRVVFSCVKSPWFDATWIGRTIDDGSIEDMKKMAEVEGPIRDNSSDSDGDGSAAEYAPLDLGGEQGEYHTMCLDGPLYDSGIEVDWLGEPSELTNQPSQKNG